METKVQIILDIQVNKVGGFFFVLRWGFDCFLLLLWGVLCIFLQGNNMSFMNHPFYPNGTMPVFKVTELYKGL